MAFDRLSPSSFGAVIGVRAKGDGVMERQAQCSCGQLKVRCQGEPEKISVCHCDACRRRTGSAFGISAFFQRDRAVIERKSKLFRHDADRSVTFHFCESCGSTVFWEPSQKPGMIGVAAGAFATADLPMPDQSVWDERRYSWIAFPDAMPRRPQN